jgi:hypothetical protein
MFCVITFLYRWVHITYNHKCQTVSLSIQWIDLALFPEIRGYSLCNILSYTELLVQNNWSNVTYYMICLAIYVEIILIYQKYIIQS